MSEYPWWAHQPSYSLEDYLGQRGMACFAVLDELYQKLLKGEGVALEQLQPILQILETHAEAQRARDKAVRDDKITVDEFQTLKIMEENAV